MNIYNQITANKRKTLFIMVFFVLFVSFVGYIFGKASGGSAFSWFIFASLFSLFSGFTSYYWGDKIVLTLNGARPADRKKDFNFYTVCENLCIASGLPLPKLYVIESPAINAFATGRDPQHSVVCATRGLLDRLERGELEGVIAHELSHVKNFDIRLMLIVSILVGVVASLADLFTRSFLWGRRDRNENRSGAIFMIIGIVLALITPLLATLIQLSISRKREYLADASGALITRNPDKLANALEKIKNDSQVLETANSGTAHLFISNPFKSKSLGRKISGLFNTHPPIEDRIRILRAM